MENEQRRTYTKEEILSLCEFGDMADSMHYIPKLLKDPKEFKGPGEFDFNTWIIPLSKRKNKKGDRRWQRIHRMLYLEPLENMPLYINAAKSYIQGIAKWRFQIGK